MKKIKFNIFILSAVLVAIISFSSCEDDGFLTNPNAELHFSNDSILFDTIFTSIGSTTKILKVYNTYDKPLLITSVELANGEASSFRLNVDGEVGNSVEDIEILPSDSIYIFVEVTIDPTGYNTPMVVHDSILFHTNQNIQDVDLLAWGQDFVPINSETIGTQTWSSEKPYLIYDYVLVDSLSTLTIEPGVKIYMHENARFVAMGNIIAEGTLEEPISFSGDRLEEDYKDIPDQWSGILLLSGSHGNVFENCTIKNALTGLQVGNIEFDGYASVSLENVHIENMAYAGIFAIDSEISANNLLIANCGFFCTALTLGGSYHFNHTTIANYWGGYSSKSRSTQSLTLQNYIVYQNPETGEDALYVGDIRECTFTNSIIYGNIDHELSIDFQDGGMSNYYFENCLLKYNTDLLDISDEDYFNTIISNENPLFIDPVEFNYQLDTLSVAQSAANIKYAELLPNDIVGQSRLADEGPDLGAYERIEKNDDDE